MIAPDLAVRIAGSSMRDNGNDPNLEWICNKPIVFPGTATEPFPIWKNCDEGPKSTAIRKKSKFLTDGIAADLFIV